MIEYFVDIIVISTLIAVLIAGYRLNKQLKSFYKIYQPVQNLNHQLITSLEKTETSLKNLKQSCENSVHALQEKIDQAHLLKEELSFLNTRADHLANQLVDHITVVQQSKTPLSAHPSSMATENISNPSPSSLKNALRNIR
jgi:uncharacterized membrane protein YraQ (UPF0718 family)